MNILKYKGIALIFDMDGVVVDNHHFHLDAWAAFCKKYGIGLTEEEFTKKMFGGSNRELLEKIFERKLSKEELETYANEKEALYREMHLPHIRPLNGLVNLLLSAREAGISTAIATAAPKANLDFVLFHTGLTDLFMVQLNESDVHKGKPDPEIYLLAASELGYPPDRCIVFEDSLTGIKAAQAAGMKVIGVTTSLDALQLQHTWKQIHDFTEITIETLLV